MEPLGNPGRFTAEATEAPAPSAGRRQIAFLVGAAVAASALVGLTVWGLTRPDPLAPRPATRFTVTAPAAVAMEPEQGLAVSPDGRTVVFAGSSPSGFQMYRRSLGEVGAVPIPGAENTFSPFFSLDGEWVGYFDQGDNRLKKVASTAPPPR